MKGEVDGFDSRKVLSIYYIDLSMHSQNVRHWELNISADFAKACVALLLSSLWLDRHAHRIRQKVLSCNTRVLALYYKEKIWFRFPHRGLNSCGQFGSD